MPAPQNVRDLLTVATTPPEEAANNIKAAEEVGATPDGYSEIKAEIEPKLEAVRKPQAADPKVVERMAQSTQHASVYAADLEKMNMFTKYWEFAGKTISGQDISRDLFNLQYRHVMGEKLNQEEVSKILDLDDDLKELNARKEEYGYNFWESLPADVVGVGYHFARGIWQGKDLPITGAAVGAVGGAALGSPAGLPGIAFGGTLAGTKGALIGLGAAQIRDELQQGTGQIYHDLSFALKPTHEGNEPIAERERILLAKGGGLMMAAVAIVPTWVMGKTVPWMRKLVSPRSLAKELIRDGGASSFRTLAMSLAKSGLAEALEEGTQEAIQIVATEMTETYDGTETSFLEGMALAGGKWESYERAGKAMVVGGVAGVGFNVGARAVGAAGSAVLPKAKVKPEVKVEPPPPPPPTDITGPSKTLPTVVKGTRAIQLKIALEQSSQILQDSNLKNHLPDELDHIRQVTMEQNGFSHIYIDPEELNKWTDSEEKLIKVSKILDKTGVSTAQLNAPIRIEAFKFLQLVDDFSDASGLAKADPEGPSASQFVERLERARLEREEFEAQLNEEMPPPPETAPEEQRTRDEDIFDEEAYLEQPTFTEEMYDVVPKDESLKINSAQLTARTEVADAINDAEQKKIDKVINLETEFALLLEREMEADKIDTDKNIQFVDNYLGNEMVGEDLTEHQQMRLEKGLPVYSIDPESLPPSLKNRFLDDEVLKQRKVFDKKGLPIKEVYQALGVKNAKSLLTILSTVPTREAAIDAAVEVNRVEIENEVRSNNDLDEGRLSKAYNNMTRNHIREMKVLLRDNWSAVKKGVKRIANPLPRMGNLINKARGIIGDTKIRDLNPNQWKVGERKSQRKAVNAILDNKLELAFREKENAALNTQLAKFAHIATGKINRALSRIAMYQTDRIQNLLKEAGPVFEDAINSVLAMYDFDRTGKARVKSDSYARFAKKMAKEGKGDFSIPDEVQKWLDTKGSYKDLTVDQLLYLDGLMRNVIHQARLKDKLLTKYEANQIEQTQEMIAAAAHEDASQHPDYDPSRLDEKQTDHSLADRTSKYLRTAENMVKNFQFFTLRLDNGKVGGFWAQLLYHALEGIGVHEGPYGAHAEGKLNVQVRNRFNKYVKDYGRKKFLDLGIQKVEVPEFEIAIGLTTKVTKLDLLMILMNMGTDGNKKAVENFGIPRVEMMEILQTHLGEAEFDLVQNAVWDTFATFKSRIAALEKLTTGKDIEFIEPEQFEAFGKTYRGGYMPLKYQKESSASKLIKDNEEKYSSVVKNDKEFLDPKYSNAFQGIVRSPHTKERVGSQWTIDIDVQTLSRGFQEVIHDLTMRVPVRDVITLMLDDSIASDIISIIGRDGYETMLAAAAEQTNTASVSQQTLLTHHQQIVDKSTRYIHGTAALTWIMFNPGSMIMSAMPVKEVLNRMGARAGGKHLVNVVTKVLNPINWHNWDNFAAAAAEIVPTIQTYRQGIDEMDPTAIAKDLPKKRLIPGKTYHLLRKSQERAVNYAFNDILGRLDYVMKVTTALAAYNQFMAGDAIGYSKDQVMAMSDTDRHAQARGYAAQIVTGTLMTARNIDKASVQKIQLMKLTTWFWNEQRNALNNRLEDNRYIKNKSKAMVEKVKAGDYAGANLELHLAGDKAAMMLLGSMFGIAITSMAMLKNPIAEEDEELTALETVTRLPEWMVTRLTTTEGLGQLGAEMYGNVTPVVRDMVFSAQSGRTLSTPILGVGMDVVRTGMITHNMLLDVDDELTLIEAAQELSEYELKTMLNTTSYIVGGLPVSAAFKANKIIEKLSDDEESLSDVLSDIAEGTAAFMLYMINRLTRFIKNNDEEKPVSEMTQEELFAKIDAEESGNVSTLQQAVNQSKGLLEKLAPSAAGDPLPHVGYEILKHAESGGRHNAYPTKRDSKGVLVPASSAYGLYQFTKDTWQLIMNLPEGRKAKLTERGRTSRKPDQQEKAMRILTKHNAALLKRKKVPVNIETLYFAHHFGTKHAGLVYSQGSKTKIKVLLTSSVLSSNPKLKKNKVKTAGDMRKYIKDAVARGRRSYNKSR